MKTSSDRSFTLDDTMKWGTLKRLTMPTLLLGLGSGAARIMVNVDKLVAREFGRKPDSLGFLSFDADLKPAGLPLEYYRRIGDGKENGFGADAWNAAHLEEKVAKQMYVSLRNHINVLADARQDFAETDARKIVQVNVMAGCGGVAGFAAKLVHKLLWPIARQRGIESLRINWFLMGPRMNVNAADRVVNENQRPQIFSNYFEICNGLRQRAASAKIGDPETVFSINILDQQSAGHSIARMAEAEAHFAEMIFFRTLTTAATYVDSQFCNHRGLKDYHGSVGPQSRRADIIALQNEE
jgi:hypothetical protein